MPVNQSSKPSIAPRPVTLTINDFSGGLNSDYTNYPLVGKENELTSMVNWNYFPTADGTKLQSRSCLVCLNPNSQLPYAANTLFYYTDTSGNGYLMASTADDKLYSINSGGTATEIGDLTDGTTSMCQFSDKLIIADSGPIKFYDTVNLALLYDVGNAVLDSTDIAHDTAYSLYSGSITRAGHKYTVVDTEIIAALGFYISSNGAPTGTVCAKIYNSSGILHATSVAINCSDVYDGNVVDADTPLTVFIFDTPVTLTYLSQYYFVVEYTGGDVGNNIDVGYTVASSSESGNTVYYDGSWHDHGTPTADTAIGIFRTGPYATVMVQKQNRVYANDLNNKNWLWFSGANDPNDWSTVNNGGYFIFDGHYRVTALAIYNDEIYIFVTGPDAIYRLTGDSPAEYTVKLVYAGISTLWHKNIVNTGADLQFTNNFGVFSMKTLSQYGQVQHSLVSNKINETKIKKSSITKCGKIEYEGKYIAVDASYKILHVLDTSNGLWGSYELALASSTVAPGSMFFGNNYSYIATSDGFIYYFKKSYLSDSLVVTYYTKDNNKEFDLSFKTAWFDLGTLQDKSARYIDCIIVGAANEGYTLNVYTDMNATTPKMSLLKNVLYQGGNYTNQLCGYPTEVNFNFHQIMFEVTGLSSGAGPYTFDRITLEANILSRY